MSLANLNTELHTFAQNFDTTYEDKAVSTRGQFLQSYPLNQLKNITLDEYVIGKGTASFCACVEAKTKAWANMQGATANKFGIYFGKTKSDPTMQYRFNFQHWKMGYLEEPPLLVFSKITNIMNFVAARPDETA